ncbi:MAG: IclR family transcriptional regulator [Pseudomonadota bacterium]|nr:IclR family transcriptional regulator [Pseudomonadota bacterium]
MPKSATRTLDLIEYLASAGTSVTHTELSKVLDIPKSSLSALIKSLMARGYVVVDQADRYRIGPRVLVLANGFLDTADVVSFAQPILARIAQTVDESAALALIEGTKALVVAHAPSKRIVQRSLSLGGQGPLSTTSAGKVLLAFCENSEEVIDGLELIQTARNSILDRDVLRKEIEEIRRSFVAYSREESIDGMIGISMPVWDSIGAVVASINVAIPAHRFTPAHEVEVQKALRSGAADITASLGGQVPPGFLMPSSTSDLEHG